MEQYAPLKPRHVNTLGRVVTIRNAVSSTPGGSVLFCAGGVIFTSTANQTMVTVNATARLVKYEYLNIRIGVTVDSRFGEVLFGAEYGLLSMLIDPSPGFVLRLCRRLLLSSWTSDTKDWGKSFGAVWQEISNGDVGCWQKIAPVCFFRRTRASLRSVSGPASASCLWPRIDWVGRVLGLG